jgi:GntR family transcriptional repressor for pyruvate dehydrogenase complex
VSTATPGERRPPIYTTVQTRVRDYAREAGLEPGARFPGERDLAQRLGVSRTSLRQALMALRVEGLIDVQHGNGVYLLRSVDERVPPLEFPAGEPRLEAHGEVRNALEALAAQLAATRRDDDDLTAMVGAIDEMERDIAAGGGGLDGDRMFHEAVLRAAGNDVLDGLLGSLADGSRRIAEASLARSAQPPRSLAAHRMILEAITGQEADLARRLMHEHLEVTGEISPPPP